MKHKILMVSAFALCSGALVASDAEQTKTVDTTATKETEAPVEITRPASPTAEELINKHGLYDALRNRTTILGLLGGWTEYQLAQHYLNPIRTDDEMQLVHFNNPNWVSYITKPEIAATFLGQATRLRHTGKLVNSDARTLAFSFLQTSDNTYDQDLLKKHGFVTQQATTPVSPRTYADVVTSPHLVTPTATADQHPPVDSSDTTAVLAQRTDAANQTSVMQRPASPLLVIEDAKNASSDSDNDSQISQYSADKAAQRRAYWLPLQQRLAAERKQAPKLDNNPWAHDAEGKYPVVTSIAPAEPANAIQDNPFAKTKSATKRLKPRARGNRNRKQ